MNFDPDDNLFFLSEFMFEYGDQLYERRRHEVRLGPVEVGRVARQVAGPEVEEGVGQHRLRDDVQATRGRHTCEVSKWMI